MSTSFSKAKIVILYTIETTLNVSGPLKFQDI